MVTARRDSDTPQNSDSIQGSRAKLKVSQKERDRFVRLKVRQVASQEIKEWIEEVWGLDR